MSVLGNIWKIKELRSRILFTLGLIFICRMVAVVPTPGVDASALRAIIESMQRTAGGGFMGMFDLFSGGALSQVAVGTLSIWPYISASIIIQLMTAIIPALERMAREGETGRQKLNQTTRYLTLFLCLIQALAIARGLESAGSLGGGDVPIVYTPGWGFRVLTMLTMTSATMLLMWLGEQITARGIGNGSSVIIMINICSRLPAALMQGASLFIPAGGVAARFGVFHLVFLLLLAFFVFAGTIALTQGLRRIPIHTARRTVGARVSGGQNTYMPLRVNYTGVMPIIFAGPILGALGWLLRQVNASWLGWLKWIGTALHNQAGWLFTITYTVLILFFSFFWVATQFNAVQIADDLKRSGGYIPGIRPGLPTAEFLDMTMTRVTLIGAIGLVVIAVLPGTLQTWMDVPGLLAGFLGGTSLLIIVGVALDTMRQIESYLVMRNYDGFLKHGRLRGRR
jgi:preprotein translocase subunit SecY